MNVQYFEELARESAAMIGGPQGLSMHPSFVNNNAETLTVNCLIRASADDGRVFPYGFTLGSTVLSQSGQAVRTTLDKNFTSAAHAFFSQRSKTSW